LRGTHFRAAAAEVMKVVTAANKYFSETEPWTMAKDEAQRERLGTVLHTALQVVSDANAMFTPFLPHSAQKVHELLGGTGVWSAQPDIHEVTDFADESPYPVLMGSYEQEQATWAPQDLPVGRPLSKPKPLVAKLDPKLAETGPEWAPIPE